MRQCCQINAVVAILYLSNILRALSVPPVRRGDPAPGRSPGPPNLRESSTIAYAEHNTSISSVLAKTDIDIWCSDEFNEPEAFSSHFSFTLFHSKFAVVNNTLIPGIRYEIHLRGLEIAGAINKVFISSYAGKDAVGRWYNVTSEKNCTRRVGVIKSWQEKEVLSWTFPDVPSFPLLIKFRILLSTTEGALFQQTADYTMLNECNIQLVGFSGELGSSDIPTFPNCVVNFLLEDNHVDAKRRRGLLVHLTRLNIPCASGGYLQFDSPRFEPFLKLCGKLEELSSADRTVHFPREVLPNVKVTLVGSPIFVFNFTSVDYCYNVTLTANNGSVVLEPSDALECRFRIHLPYGNRVLLRLQVGEEENMKDVTETSSIDPCDGLMVRIWDGSENWTHCSQRNGAKRDVQVWSVRNIVELLIEAPLGKSHPGLRFWYHAESISDVVGNCEYGEVAVDRYCVFPVYTPMGWKQAEGYCMNREGHLLSIRDETAQYIVDNLLLMSPLHSEQDSFWIGASDSAYEGHYQWSDGHSFTFSNWFSGWPQHGYSNRQPNDDGFSKQDCVEVRRTFPAPLITGGTSTSNLLPSYQWNDIDCSTSNFFLCERVLQQEALEESRRLKCNKTIRLSAEHPRAVVASPDFPHAYPDNARCVTIVTAPAGFRIILDFEEFVLEKEPLCSYDSLDLIDVKENTSSVVKRLCGDLSDQLKLQRFVSNGSQINLVFVSDYSHHFGGFKARLSIENAGLKCADENHKMFNSSCYLFVGYPGVTWQTAQQTCSGIKAQLASVISAEEEAFITANIRKSFDYSTGNVYWLGGRAGIGQTWEWIDGSPMDFTAWPPDGFSDHTRYQEPSPSCLGIQWISSKEPNESGLYWSPKICKATGGYVCKKAVPVSGDSGNFSKTINGTEGYLTSPGYPGLYGPNLDYEVRVVGPAWTRIVITLSKLDIESQPDCLYDFLELKSGGVLESEKRWCGSWNTKVSRFVSRNNEALLHFHSDYSVSGTGFRAFWKAIDVSGCPSQTLTAREGILSSPNYPDFVLPHLDCTTVILAPIGKRIWLEFSELSVTDEHGESKDASLELDLGGGFSSFQPLPSNSNISIGGGSFVSRTEKLVVRLRTGERPHGVEFRAVYRSITSVHEEKIVELQPDANGLLRHLNFPASPPYHVDFLQHLVAPSGYIISLEFDKVVHSENGSMCPDGKGVIEVNDNYADVNGTWWFLCPVDELEMKYGGFQPSAPPFAVTSYLHTLHIRQRSLSSELFMNATLRVKEDPQFKLKLLRLPEDISLESCRPNPCLNGGRCISSSIRKTCQCNSHFTGLFCALTQCELEPCLFGMCELTTSGYHCRCQAGYTGRACEQKQRPCAENPCEGRGECIERGDTFYCQCHAWWEGVRCERKMTHIPFKPLSERMLQEPFWLGLITVFVVLGIIGLVWCAKRHFPEKLEKLLADEADRHHRSNHYSSQRPSSLRDQHSAIAAVASTNAGGQSLQSPQSQTNGVSRSLFGRLGIRKPSLLSLTGFGSGRTNDRVYHDTSAASRTFSLDDLLRPPPGRSPSPRKKRTNSTPTKKYATEKNEILQQLVSPSANTKLAKVTFGELIQMNDHNRSADQSESENELKETSFIDPKLDISRLEKKVTFARLLNKVSAEMSSGSEKDCIKAPLEKALSTPTSPLSDQRTSRGSIQRDSLSSSDISVNMESFPQKRRSHLKPIDITSRNPSADSILAMLRGISTTSSVDDTLGSDDTSSILGTPVSASSDHSDSSLFCQNYTIEVPVFDSLSVQKTSQTSNLLQPPSILLEIPTGGINKCLSPIREVPTPIASPALTPVMTRSEPKPDVPKVFSSDEKTEDDDETEESEQLVVEIHQDADNNSQGLVIPVVVVEEPSPKRSSKLPIFTFMGSPPPQRKYDTSATLTSPQRKLLKEFDKPMSLDLIQSPPMITITCNMSEAESDTESGKPLTACPNEPGNGSGMSYLSPFSMCSRGDRTVSESNLSSSGYSSMASPGPSRCGSNNPLCLSEVEDQGAQSQPPSRRPSPLLRTPTPEQKGHLRRRSDSETLSDDPLLESNDEGIGTDQLDEKLEDGEKLKEGDPSRGGLRQKLFDSVDANKASLQLPTIVVQPDNCDKLLSPVSSRSESPLSDKTLGIGRFSPMFYCKNKSELPFTDSDGLYDFPSSDCPLSKNKSVQACSVPHRKRRERRSIRGNNSVVKCNSPTKGISNLDTMKEPPVRMSSPRKPSPKRRSRAITRVSSSSSSESVTCEKGVSIRLTSPDGTNWPVHFGEERKVAAASTPASNEASGEETGEDIPEKFSSSSREELSRPIRNLSRLRSIAHQIRFLRRIEMSLRRKERILSLTDSGGKGIESDDDLEKSMLLSNFDLPPSIRPAAEVRTSNSKRLTHQRKLYRSSRKRSNSPLLISGNTPLVYNHTD